MDLLQDLLKRGATQVDLIVTDGHDGLLAAVSALFTATLRQRCVVHKQRNVMNAIPKREQEHGSDGVIGHLEVSRPERGSAYPIGSIQRKVPPAIS